MNFELQKAKYTHCNTGGLYSRIDRFIVNTTWIEHFRVHTKRAKGYFRSDHRLLIPQGNGLKPGPRPFRFELFWLEKPKLIQK